MTVYIWNNYGINILFTEGVWPGARKLFEHADCCFHLYNKGETRCDLEIRVGATISIFKIMPGEEIILSTPREVSVSVELYDLNGERYIFGSIAPMIAKKPD